MGRIDHGQNGRPRVSKNISSPKSNSGSPKIESSTKKKRARGKGKRASPKSKSKKSGIPLRSSSPPSHLSKTKHTPPVKSNVKFDPPPRVQDDPPAATPQTRKHSDFFGDISPSEIIIHENWASAEKTVRKRTSIDSATGKDGKIMLAPCMRKKDVKKDEKEITIPLHYLLFCS